MKTSITKLAFVWVGCVLMAATAPLVWAQLCPPGWTCDCKVETPYPPTGASWAVVENPSFENGFTGGVGNDWTATWANFVSDPTFSDSTLRATHGSHSQRADIPEVTSSYTSQRCGLYQQLYVVPGETYSLSMDIYMELDGNEQFSGQNTVAIAGLDPYGDTNIQEGSIKWSPLQGDKGAWRTVSVSTDAIFEVMSVYVAVLRKDPGFGEARFWIDNVQFSGTFPTGPPSPPEQEPPDPDANIPATVGSERVTNSSFEGSWSNGLAANWTSWSTAGTGYWRQSTLIGKVGAGKYDFGEADTVANMNPKTALTMQIGDADGWATRANMVDSIIVGRLFIDPYIGQYLSDPEYYGRVHADNCKVEQDYHPRITCWVGFNEPDWGDENWPKVLVFEKAFAERCHELGMQAVVLNLATGNPGNIWKMLEAKDVLAVGDYVGYHSYGGPNDQLMVNGDSPVLDDPCSFSLRWRKYVDMYRDRGWRMPPVIYTEGTTYGGWHGNFTANEIRDDLIAFGGYMNEDRWCAGLTLFVAGGTGVWSNWDIRDQGDIDTACGTWNAANPSEATDGLYSQQFGAGYLYARNSTEYNDIDGEFTGGVCQQITGLVSDNTYLLDLDFRYEFRGVQPQITFQTGVDLTGQTGNPNAGSISWSGDIVAGENAVQSIWERTWRTFTATGSTASIWLKSNQTVTDPTYRISVDRVSVLQVADGSNLPPTAVAEANPTEGDEPLQVNFDGTGSSDPDQDPLTYSWDWDDGTADGSGATPSHTFTDDGTYSVMLTVDDGNGGVDSDTVVITVNAVSSGPSLTNGDFSNGLTGWSQWTDRGDISFSDNAGRGHITGNNINGGLWQQFNTGGVSTVIDIAGWWASNPTTANNQWAEVLIINGSRTPTNGQDINDGQSDVEMIYKNDTWTTPGGWSGNMDVTSPVANVGTFTADDTVATIILKMGNTGGSTNGTLFDNLVLSGGPAPTPTIALNKSSLSPSCDEDSSPVNDTFTVSNSGTGTLNYSISDDVGWLSCNPDNGTSTGEADTITVTYLTASLSPGTYNATISVTDAGATNSPQTIAVTLTVNVRPATITLDPMSLSPSCDEGSNPANDSFTVQNTGGSTTLNYSISDNVGWLSCNPDNGTSDGEADTITVTYAASGLSADTYNGTITVSDPAATNSPQTIAVTLTVNATTTTVAEDFETMPSWSSSYDAGWGSAASWSIVGGGQSGNALQASRGSAGSSVKVKVYDIDASTDYTISIYIRCPSYGGTYWAETAYKFGNNSANNFDDSAGSWTMIKKFANDGTNGNGDTWTQYSVNFNSGSDTQISVGYKLGSWGGGGPTVRWDTLRVE